MSGCHQFLERMSVIFGSCALSISVAQLGTVAPSPRQQATWPAKTSSPNPATTGHQRDLCQGSTTATRPSHTAPKGRHCAPSPPKMTGPSRKPTPPPVLCSRPPDAAPGRAHELRVPHQHPVGLVGVAWYRQARPLLLPIPAADEALFDLRTVHHAEAPGGGSCVCVVVVFCSTLGYFSSCVRVCMYGVLVCARGLCAHLYDTCAHVHMCGAVHVFVRVHVHVCVTRAHT